LFKKKNRCGCSRSTVNKQVTRKAGVSQKQKKP